MDYFSKPCKRKYRITQYCGKNYGIQGQKFRINTWLTLPEFKNLNFFRHKFQLYNPIFLIKVVPANDS